MPKFPPNETHRRPSTSAGRGGERRLLGGLLRGAVGMLGLTALVLSGCGDGQDAQQTADGEESPAAQHAVDTGERAREPLDCTDGQQPLSHAMDNGAEWAMCFSVDPDAGMVLHDVTFAAPGQDPVRLIRTMALAQLEVPYDSGERLTSDITRSGFGGTKMHTLTSQECAGELISHPVPDIGDGTHGETRDREVLCSEGEDSGLAYRLSEGGEVSTARGQQWSLSTVSKVGWYEYISRYTFGSDGSITPALGATGDLSPVDFTDEAHGWAVGEGEADYAASHSHNAVWRIRWGLGEDEPMQVEQYDAAPTGDWGEESPVLEGEITTIDEPTLARAEDRRWWRVLAPDLTNDDDHAISYEISLGATDSFTFVHDQEAAQEEAGESGESAESDESGESVHDHEHEDLGYDVAFTSHDECEKFATENREGDCGPGVPEYVEESAGESLEDVVSWVAVGFHHVPRDEEQSPMEMHWQSFDLVPRDLTASRPDAPEGREDVNGVPTDSPYREDVDLDEPQSPGDAGEDS